MFRKFKAAFKDKDKPSKPSKSSTSTAQKKEWIDANDIMLGFDQLSKCMMKLNPDRARDPVKIVVAGGTCSVLVLQNRSLTRDIDFFHMDPDIVEEVFVAKHDASHYLSDFPSSWINAEMLAFVLNNPGCETLFEDSLEQNHVLFQSDVLVVYAADWRYQLVGKIERAYASRKASEKVERNLLDAVFLLRLLVTQNNGNALKLATVRTWYFYGPSLEDDEVEYVNAAYIDRYDEGPGIDIE